VTDLNEAPGWIGSFKMLKITLLSERNCSFRTINICEVNEDEDKMIKIKSKY